MSQTTFRRREASAIAHNIRGCALRNEPAFQTLLHDLSSYMESGLSRTAEGLYAQAETLATRYNLQPEQTAQLNEALRTSIGTLGQPQALSRVS
jgi:hypothetical protein